MSKSPNYKNSKIYKILSLNDNLQYIGSTTGSLGCRLSQHISHSKNLKLKSKFNLHIQKNNNNKKNYEISLIINYPCNNKEELHKKESYYQNLFDTINNGLNSNYSNTTEYDYKMEYSRNTKKIKLLEKSILKLKNDNLTLIEENDYKIGDYNSENIESINSDCDKNSEYDKTENIESIESIESECDENSEYDKTENIESIESECDDNKNFMYEENINNDNDTYLTYINNELTLLQNKLTKIRELKEHYITFKSTNKIF